MKRLAVESVRAMTAVRWKLKVERRTEELKKMALTGCQREKKKMEKSPTLNCLGVSLQRVLIEKNVRTVGLADGDFTRFFQCGQMEARR